MPYTINDEPRVVQRIRSDLDQAVQMVRAADRSLRSLVLTGGFSRGEGAMLDGAPQNDYDLIAIRGGGGPALGYDQLRKDLERKLGLHVDLAPVAAWRLPWVAPTIFWYETALRGHTLWGENLLDRLPLRQADALDRREGLRLLVNRAAGLLLVSGSKDGNALRLQAAKALLASADARLLATGRFAPSQHERWEMILAMRKAGVAPRGLQPTRGWFEWAFRYKVDPGAAAVRDPQEAWQAARAAILESIPVALEHARFRSLEQYGRQGGLLDALRFLHRSSAVPQAVRWASHPTGRVRVATIRLLQAAIRGQVSSEDASRCFAGIARGGTDPLPMLEGLRAATLQ